MVLPIKQAVRSPEPTGKGIESRLQVTPGLAQERGIPDAEVAGETVLCGNRPRSYLRSQRLRVWRGECRLLHFSSKCICSVASIGSTYHKVSGRVRKLAFRQNLCISLLPSTEFSSCLSLYAVLFFFLV